MIRTEEEREMERWIDNIEQTGKIFGYNSATHEEEVKKEIQYFKDRLTGGDYKDLEKLKQQEWNPYNDRYGVSSLRGRVAELVAQAWLRGIYYLEGIKDVTSSKYYNYECGVDILILKWKRNNSVQCKATTYKGEDNDTSKQLFCVRKDWLDCANCKATRIIAIDLNMGIGFMADRECLRDGIKHMLGNEVWVSVEKIREITDSRMKDVVKGDFDLNYLER